MRAEHAFLSRKEATYWVINNKENSKSKGNPAKGQPLAFPWTFNKGVGNRLGFFSGRENP